MPYTYTINAVQDAVRIRATGRITDGELVSLSKDIATDAAYRRSMRFITDTTHVTRNELTPNGFNEAATLLGFLSAIE